ALFKQHTSPGWISGHGVGSARKEFYQVNPETVPRPFSDMSRLLEVRDRLLPGAALVVDIGAILIGGRLGEGVLQLLGQADTVIDIGEGLLKLAQEPEGKTREASGGGFLAH